MTSVKKNKVNTNKKSSCIKKIMSFFPLQEKKKSISACFHLYHEDTIDCWADPAAHPVLYLLTYCLSQKTEVPSCSFVKTLEWMVSYFINPFWRYGQVHWGRECGPYAWDVLPIIKHRRRFVIVRLTGIHLSLVNIYITFICCTRPYCPCIWATLFFPPEILI